MHGSVLEHLTLRSWQALHELVEAEGDYLARVEEAYVCLFLPYEAMIPRSLRSAAGEECRRRSTGRMHYEIGEDDSCSV